VIFSATDLPGAWIIGVEPHEDERGFFARAWCAWEFADHGLETAVAQCNLSRNRRRGTLRGMHYQAAPHEEAKVVRCVRGAAHLVALDLRPASPAFTRHVTLEATADNGAALYVPKGCALGFQTLADDTDIFYQMSEFYAPESGRGVRWDDPAFGIRWPIPDPIMLARDRAYPDFVRP
jgi:dTDP-4-dehydrorhamnose 3,5-epimerase